MVKLLTQQKNATLEPGLVMRVGIPHRNGALSAHAFENDYPAMVSANAFWNPTKASFEFPDITNLSELDFAMDSAGFTAMKLWQQKGKQAGIAGIFPWSFSQYIEMATTCGANWWSAPDLCCEPEIAADADEVDYRVRATATLLEGTLSTVRLWQEQLVESASPIAVANILKPPVPVLQGWSADDYLRSLDLMQKVWQRYEPWLASPALIGVGSVCRRSLDHPKHGLYAILNQIERHLPTGSKLHLFGVKGACLSEIKMRDYVASADSMAYDFGARIKARKDGISNNMRHRCDEMTRWMNAAERRLESSPGDQMRLSFGSAKPKPGTDFSGPWM